MVKTGTPGVYRRGGTYSIVVDLGRDPATGRRRQKTQGGFKTLKAAREARAEMVAGINRGGYVPPSRQTLAQWAEEWLVAIDSRELAPATVYSYRRNVRLHLLPVLGAVPLRDVDAAMATRLYAQLRRDGNKSQAKFGQPLSVRSVRYLAAIVSEMLKDARRAGRMARNPAEDATVPKGRGVARPTIKVWTGDQTAAFLDCTANHRLTALWVLLAHTGARRGEILGLSWEDVDLNTGALHIRRALSVVAHRVHLGDTKTADSVRTVALDARSADALRAHRKRQAAERLAMGAGWADTGLVFTTPKGEWLHPERVSRTFGELAARSGLPVIRLHDLRHGWATAALTANVPIKVISDRLGHRTTAITADVYSHVLREVQGDAAERVAALFLGSSTGSR